MLRAINGVVGWKKQSQWQDDVKLQMRIAAAIFEELARDSQEKKIPFLLVLLPELREFRDPQMQEQFKIVSSTIDRFASQYKIPYLNLYSAFERQTSETRANFYRQDQFQHFSEAGNLFVAEKLDEALSQLVPAYPGRNQ